MLSAQKTTEKLLRDFSRERNNPYMFFARETEPAPTREVKKDYGRPEHEEEALREQRQTLFAHDEVMREVFSNDFEAYSDALDNPELMIQRLTERTQALAREIEEQMSNMETAADWWQDEFWGENEEEDEEESSDDDASAFANATADETPWLSDELYQKTNKWAQRLFGVGSKIYEEEKRKDADLFRVVINVFLVPAKIVYAASMGDYVCEDCGEVHEAEGIDSELSLHGYTLCLTFLERVRESLSNLISKNFAPLDEWRAAKLASDELAVEIQGRMIELAKRLQF